MGRQVNFYLEPRDVALLETAIRALGDVCILHSRSPNHEPRVVSTTAVEENGQPWLFFYLARPEELSAIVTRHVPTQKYWAIDVLRSPVIEFCRSFFDGKTIRRGRLYYTDSFYDENGALVRKGESFLEWAGAVAKCARRALKRQGGDYVGQFAEALVGAGSVKLET